jgi:hypothetical protein
MVQAENHTSRVLRVALAFALLQLGLHVAQLVTVRDPHLVGPHIVAWLQDLVILAIVVWVPWSIVRQVRQQAIGQCLSAVSIIILFVGGMLLAIYPRFLTEFLAFPVNIFRADGGSARIFVTDYLGWQSLLPVGVSVACGLWAMRVSWRPTWTRTRAIAALLFSALAIITLTGPSPQPIVFGVQQIASHWFSGRERAVPSLVPPSKTTSSTIPLEPSPLASAQSFRYDHVFICVLEGVTETNFEAEFLAIGEGSWARVRNDAVRFTNYYSTNLDSYTSLIAMLTSIQVPYRAYANPGRFEAVNAAPNLTAALRGHGFQTLFVNTSDFLPFVPVRNDWHRIVTGDDLPKDSHWVSVGTSPVESAVEDRAAISTMVEFMKSHDRTLVMHEMKFGHSPQWVIKIGKMHAEYCADYFRELLAALAQLDIDKRTLFVLTTDHGDRAEPANPQNYRVPLLLFGAGIKPGIDKRFLCHLDFQHVVGHYLSGLPLPESRDGLTTVGSTESWTYGEITAAGEHQFIDNAWGIVLAQRGQLDPSTLHRRFQNYLAQFEAVLDRGSTLAGNEPSKPD